MREAFRILAQRGLAAISPRRGVHVIDFSLDSLVDLFNMRAVLMGLGARYFAVMAVEDARTALDEALAALSDVAHARETDPATFTRATARISLLIARQCGSDSLGQLIEHQNDRSAWGTLWLSGRMDFATRERRLAATADYLAMGEAIRERNGADAEALMRRMVMLSRESAVAAIADRSDHRFDTRRMLVA